MQAVVPYGCREKQCSQNWTQVAGPRSTLLLTPTSLSTPLCLWDYYPHFSGRKTEAQSRATQLAVPPWQATELGFERTAAAGKDLIFIRGSWRLRWGWGEGCTGRSLLPQTQTPGAAPVLRLFQMKTCLLGCLLSRERRTRRPENGHGEGRDIYRGGITPLAPSLYLHISSSQHHVLWFYAHLQVGKLSLRLVLGSFPLYGVSFLA